MWGEKKARDKLLVSEAAHVLGIPCTVSLKLEGRHVVVPNVPLLAFGKEFFHDPAALLERLGTSGSHTLSARWQQLLHGVRHLANPFTRFRGADAGTKEAAISVFSAGIIVADEIQGARVVLPPSIGVKPNDVRKSTHVMNGFTFKYNEWSPPSSYDLQHLSRGSDVIPFTLITSTGTRNYQLPFNSPR